MSSTGRKSVTFKETGETLDGCAGCQLREREKADAMALARGTQRLLLRNQEAYFRLEDACREMQRRHKETTAQQAQQNAALQADKCDVEAKLARAYIELAELRQIREQYHWMKEHWPTGADLPQPDRRPSCAPVEHQLDGCISCAPMEAASCAPMEAARCTPMEAARCTPMEAARCAPMEAARCTPIETASCAPMDGRDAKPDRRSSCALIDNGESDGAPLIDMTEVEGRPCAAIKENQGRVVEIGRPSRRATATLCYREPALNVKLRQGRAPGYRLV